MNYNVFVEGQTIPVPEDIGSNDESVKRALTPFYPEVANAMITRTEKDGITTITVVKKAGSKGLTKLIACPGGMNPAIRLYEEITRCEGALDPLELLEMDTRISAAVEEGTKQAESVRFASERLVESLPQAARMVVEGF